ncbi:hypothetical protein [Streptobacillus moniliformis]|uniref:Outer membrane protein beta-barrel domain-containing protein n=1 Tax=Streptobacillus moniliformis (strain ATCC 14647 / DSM 12112 / NCTC 10651 / 9901) TaxID=519441 RepID=D1AVK3_STRM9|nr:hypothetical protein [Streptobacillus moniliformis]ACZ01763.1 hypothetical protein Smon_1313 [Streptobacillus moniliformis DSM 12112]SQA13050.1 Uncharacterised protein [Streptobacillus moniliformis]
MKKILLSIILFIGLTSFSVENNKVSDISDLGTIENRNEINNLNNTNYMLNKKEENKKVDEAFTKLSGPRYRVEVALGAISTKSDVKANEYISTSTSFLAEWKADINEKFYVTFGPKVNLNVATIIQSTGTKKITPNIALGGEVDFNYNLKERLKIYAGAEIGLGIGPLIENGTLKNPELITVGKMSFGLKIDDKYNVAVYTGNIKGVLGIEAGYTF